MQALASARPLAPPGASRRSAFRARLAPSSSSPSRVVVARAGNPFVEGWLDLSATVTGGGADLGVSELAERIGSDVYMDINGWHLFLRDAKYHVPLARIVATRVADDGNRLEETAIETILKECPVRVGGGKSECKLFDLMPSACVQDFMKIVEDYADDL